MEPNLIEQYLKSSVEILVGIPEEIHHVIEVQTRVEGCDGSDCAALSVFLEECQERIR